MKMFFENLKNQLLLMLLLFMICCKKSDVATTPNIVGKWLWFKTYSDLPLSDSNPKTPANTGIQEVFTFNDDYTWSIKKNNVTQDSGTFTVGHNTLSNLSGTKYDYDSIKYFWNTLPRNFGWDYYQIYSNDTLLFEPGLGDRWVSYTLPNGGSKWWVKQH
jgi:hypothetical protein